MPDKVLYVIPPAAWDHNRNNIGCCTKLVFDAASDFKLLCSFPQSDACWQR